MWIWITSINQWKLFNHSEIVLPLLIGFLLDSLFGDPYWLPHPIRLFGKLISVGEEKLNRGKQRKFKGAILSLSLILFTFVSFWIVLKFLSEYKILYVIVASIFIFYGLANRSLIQESLKVIRVLNNEGVVAGRQQLSRIVGRETSKLSENQIRIAVLETLAENLSDGVVAPLFYYAIGGVPAMLTYKMANTLDSMIGYKNDRYKDFGWLAAKFDDVLNFIPARITALLMVVLTFSWRGFIFIFKYGPKHSSPNAGYPEAALAGILNCRFGGPNMYHGNLVDKPFIGRNAKEIKDLDVVRACYLNFATATLVVVVVVLNNIFILT